MPATQTCSVWYDTTGIPSAVHATALCGVCAAGRNGFTCFYLIRRSTLLCVLSLHSPDPFHSLPSLLSDTPFLLLLFIPPTLSPSLPPSLPPYPAPSLPPSFLFPPLCTLLLSPVMSCHAMSFRCHCVSLARYGDLFAAGCSAGICLYLLRRKDRGEDSKDGTA